jgi:hypothetical protein
MKTIAYAAHPVRARLLVPGRALRPTTTLVRPAA